MAKRKAPRGEVHERRIGAGFPKVHERTIVDRLTLSEYPAPPKPADDPAPQTRPKDADLIPVNDAAEVMDIDRTTIRRRLKAQGLSALWKRNGRDAATLEQYRLAFLAPKDEPRYKLLAAHYGRK